MLPKYLPILHRGPDFLSAGIHRVSSVKNLSHYQMDILLVFQQKSFLLIC